MHVVNQCVPGVSEPSCLGVAEGEWPGWNPTTPLSPQCKKGWKLYCLSLGCLVHVTCYSRLNKLSSYLEPSGKTLLLCSFPLRSDLHSHPRREEM